MIRVVTHQRRHIEVCRYTGLPLRDEILKAFVSVFAGTETGNLAHGPRSRTIHRWVGAACKRISARQTNVFYWSVGEVGRRVGSFYGDIAEGEKLALKLRLLAKKMRHLIAFPVPLFGANLIDSLLRDSHAVNGLFHNKVLIQATPPAVRSQGSMGRRRVSGAVQQRTVRER